MKEKSHQGILFLLDSLDVVRLVTINFSVLLRFDLVSFIDYTRNIFIRILSVMLSNFQVLFVDLFSFIYECLNKSSFLPSKQIILVAGRPATILNSSWLGKELTKPTRMTCSIVRTSSTR